MSMLNNFSKVIEMGPVEPIYKHVRHLLSEGNMNSYNVGRHQPIFLHYDSHKLM